MWQATCRFAHIGHIPVRITSHSRRNDATLADPGQKSDAPMTLRHHPM